jgi:hypothetical protein
MKFIPGMKLSESFYTEAVKPILESEFPNIEYSAGLIGSGSEVLGFDTSQSTDHDWGPRMLLFLSEHDYRRYRDEIWVVLSNRLPHRFRGYSTSFGQPDNKGVRLIENTTSGPVNHRVEIYTIKSYFEEYLKIDPYKKMENFDWLKLSEHKLLSIRKGKIFYDGLGVNKTRRKLRFYPRDVWFHFLSLHWRRIAQEEAFVGRCGDVGDDLGSRMIASRLVEELIRLCFLMEKEYAPYSKWLGTAFSELKSSKKLKPILARVLSASTWKEREKHLSQAFREVAKLHNGLQITEPLKTEVSSYYSRPYLVINAEEFADQITRLISDLALARRGVELASAE